MPIFKEMGREDRFSGGQAALLWLLHQLVATPGSLFVSSILLFVTGAPFSRPQAIDPAHSLGSEAAILLFLCVAFAVGFSIGRLSPTHARFGYWSWVVPTILFTYDFWANITVYHSSITKTVSEYFNPNNHSLTFLFLTIPWMQSFFYSVGLRFGASYGRLKTGLSADPRTTGDRKGPR